MLMVNDSFKPRLPMVVLAGGALWLVFFALFAIVMPALPVDETRYLTVAWEMHLSHHWLLLTVNGAPYSHKPPLLFWLINLMWAGLGTSIWAARLIAGAAALGAYALTWRLARQLYPDRPQVATLAPLLLLGCPAFLAYGGLIMFDTLLTCFVVLALEQAWRAGRAAHDAKAFWRAWLLFGLFTGIGVLVKGPVVALYVFFPPLLMPFFMPGVARGRWYRGVLLGLLLATLIGLAWAIPAAVEGGPAFAQMLFVKQSAGRMVDAFAHRRPFWFFIPCVPIFALPFLVWPPFWRAVRRGREPVRAPAGLFLTAALIGPFLCFSAISSKQVHYMLPLLPSAAILLAALFDRITVDGAVAGATTGQADKTACRPADIAGPMLLLLVAFIGAAIFFHTPGAVHSHNRLIAATAAGFLTPWFAGALALAFVVAYLSRRRVENQLLAIAFGVIAVGAATVWQANGTALPFHDLRPVAAFLQPYKQGPVAFSEKYDGEIGYLATLTHPMDVVTRREIPGWLQNHPDGTVIYRHDGAHPADNLGKIIGRFDYKAGQDYTFLQAGGSALPGQK